jgi:hypothetical protein
MSRDLTPSRQKSRASLRSRWFDQFGSSSDPERHEMNAMTDISDPRRAVQETTTEGALRVLEERVMDV